MDAVKAWHFTDGNKLSDGGSVPAAGEWLEHEGEIIPGQCGLHASVNVLDALKYAPGSTLHRVEVASHGKYDPAGLNTSESDKIVGRRRRVLYTVNAQDILLRFAADCAARALEKYGTGNDACWVAIDIVLAKLAGLDIDSHMLLEAKEAAWVERHRPMSSLEHAAASAAASAASAPWWKVALSVQAASWCAAGAAKEPLLDPSGNGQDAREAAVEEERKAQEHHLLVLIEESHQEQERTI